MAGPESEHIYGVQLRESANDGSDFSNGDTDYRIMFLGEDGSLHLKDSAGTVTDIGGSSAPAFAGAKAYATSTQNVNNTAAALTFDSEEYDTDGFHDTASNQTKMTIPSGKDGYYLLEAGSFASGSTDFCYFKKNGTTIIRGGQTFGRASATYNQAHAIAHLVATDYVEFFVSNTISVNYGHATAPDAQSWFAVSLLGS